MTLPGDMAVCDMTLPDDMAVSDDMAVCDMTLPDDMAVCDMTLPDDMAVSDDMTASRFDTDTLLTVKGILFIFALQRSLGHVACV
jgi:hypothetical protein